MQVIRWGILGASEFARKHMAPAIHAADGASLVALATASPERFGGFIRFCPDLCHHHSYDALLDDPEIDAVYIPLPNHLHVDWALRANRAGKHVLCEKPIALEAPQIDSLIAARDASGLQLAEAFMILHHPQWRQARDWIAEGRIGRLVHADAVFSYPLARNSNIRNRPDTGGGGLRDIGVYTLGGMRFATGAEPVLTETTARLELEEGVDAFAHVFGRMQGPGGGFSFASTTSMRAYNRQTVTFQGSEGMIRLDGGVFNSNVNDMASVELHQGGNQVLTHRFPAVQQYRLQVEAFGQAIREGGGFAVPLEFSRGTQVVIDHVLGQAGQPG